MLLSCQLVVLGSQQQSQGGQLWNSYKVKNAGKIDVLFDAIRDIGFLLENFGKKRIHLLDFDTLIVIMLFLIFGV